MKYFMMAHCSFIGNNKPVHGNILKCVVSDTMVFQFNKNTTNKFLSLNSSIDSFSN